MNKIMKFGTYYESRENQKVCIFLRGLPGSGKSFSSDQVMKEFGGTDRAKHVFSSDDYWIEDGLKQGLPPDELKALYRQRWSLPTVFHAHTWNFARIQRALDAGVSPVIVDSVHTKAAHMRDCAKYAADLGYEIVVREPGSPWWKEHAPLLNDKKANAAKLDQFAKFLAGRNEHGVPEDSLRRMLQNYTPNVTPQDILNR